MGQLKLSSGDCQHRAHVLRELAAITPDKALASAYRARAKEYDAEAVQMEQPVCQPMLIS